MERPERYKSREVNGMDVIDLVNHWGLNFSQGNILKYLLRDKGEDLSDMKKIVQYAQREVERMEGKPFYTDEDEKAIELCKKEFSRFGVLDMLKVYISDNFEIEFSRVSRCDVDLPFTKDVYYVHQEDLSKAYYPYGKKYIVIEYKNDVSF